MQDGDDGGYYHVLSGDFTRKEKLRTVYYDGEATFALCRLYGQTGSQIWLDAAQNAVAYFIREDYTQYKDHWIAYSMNEIHKRAIQNGGLSKGILRRNMRITIQPNLDGCRFVRHKS
ncbi:hypothetical protein [Parablautia muri]|uniref:Uncharacterized protein n=1 Tax=Parablautia muri TaxID=2320879 RepID=A0A9X5BD43_9FIRM|nr:hypothetical protein [Parablautia muri]NBJ91786.1 hypothetical protein [Parablautia muri]